MILNINQLKHTHSLLYNFFNDWHIDDALDYLYLAIFSNVSLPIINIKTNKGPTGTTTLLLWINSIKQKAYLIDVNDLNKINPLGNYIMPGSNMYLLDHYNNDDHINSLILDLHLKTSYKYEVKSYDAVMIEMHNNFIITNSGVEGNARLWTIAPDIITNPINDFSSLLDKEIPLFLNFLKNRKLSKLENRRMLFHIEDLNQDIPF